MREIRLSGEDITREEVRLALVSWLSSLQQSLNRVLLVPPDFTRSHSQAGLIVQLLWEELKDSADVYIMPALGTHVPITDEERVTMFGVGIPKERFLVHNWRSDVVKIGEVPARYVEEVSEGRLNYPIDVELNRRLLDKSYDLIVSIGQVVPHEVVGMANYTKNLLVGCGGKSMIDKTHFLGAVYGMERLMGRDHSPVRNVFDYAEEHFLCEMPLQYILTVTKAQGDIAQIKGVFAGRDRSLFEDAVKLSQRENFDLLDRPLKKVVVYLDGTHFKSTWLGNKAIYRTRMAIADGGELIILGPGIERFGEDREIDKLIRKYGYSGTPHILRMVSENADLRENLSAAAHLIHGSSEGRFCITYAPGHLTRDEVESVNFKYMPFPEAIEIYDPQALRDGHNIANGEDIFFISNPAVGLWALKEQFAS